MTNKLSVWRTTKLKDVCDRITVGYVGPMADEYTPEGITFLRSQNIEPFRLSLKDVKFIPRKFNDKIKKSALRPGDVAVVRTGYPGTACVIPASLPESNCADLVVITPSKELNSFYLAAIFNSAWGMASVRGNLVGVAQQHFNVGAAKEMVVTLPPRAEQDRIAGILSAYDELIENSQRRIRLLEDMARALYREWFVHFRFPGHEHTLPVADLPGGWKRRPLEEVAEFRLGKMLDQEKNRGDLLSYLANMNVRWGEFDLRGLREMRFEKDELETYGLKFGDIVMCEGGEPGRCAIWKEQIPGMMIQKAIHRIRCRENMDHIYLYHCLRLQGESGQLASLFTGATIKHLPREKLAKVTVVVPPAPILKRFGEFAKPMEAHIEKLQRQIQNLRRTRDLLLPRLLSGQVALESVPT
ncbi:restriction endonuclease subunit S [Prosthecobacter sp.]|uniref:restriction endonuclease subunit S n=1 Tax=Prosthecobacter sp. TaxID=1965333 RepID=UPI0024899F2B|nr:restriction endonuclease subunit S [Prosthecobacter sp.]MDI1314743.1 restriction endonuclease subunit S [Prosthecobacter sp.]